MLPRTLLNASFHLEGEQIRPHYFTARDEVWLRALLEECLRFVGRKRSELSARLREPLPVRAPRTKLRVAIHVLDALSRARTSAVVAPKEARAATFREAAGRSAAREAVLDSVATALGVTARELEDSLFADLRGERVVAGFPEDLSASRLAWAANLALVAALIRRAVHVRIAASHDGQALVRHSRLMGLLCTAAVGAPLAHSRLLADPADPADPADAANPANPALAPRVSEFDTFAGPTLDGVVLDISGPFVLFRHTEVYGRALASLVPRLAQCETFELRATCTLGRGSPPGTFVLRSGDPIGPGSAAAPGASPLGEQFVRDFRRAAPEWDLIREPTPIQTGSTLIFPDFELVHRQDKQRRWLLEIVGFWTEKYLSEKLERLRAVGIERLVLCIDQRRHCAEGGLPRDAQVVGYKRRIDPRAVLDIIDATR